MNNFVRIFELGDITKRLDDPQDVAAGAYEWRCGQNSRYNFSIQSLFIHIGFTVGFTTHNSCNWTGGSMAHRTTEDIVTLLVNHIRLCHISHDGKRFIDFHNIVVSVNHPHADRCCLKNLIKLGVGLFECLLHLLAL